MKVLFIGGTGNISSYCVELALERGYGVTVLNRGKTQVSFSRPVTTVIGDRNDRALLRQVAEREHFDVACDFIGYLPEEVAVDIDAFSGQVGQFLYISSVAAYQKPPRYYIHTESTPLHNPFWKYASDKIACENLLNQAYREKGFPMTIVRPWHTYGETRIPCALGGAGYTVVDRMRKGLPIVCHGDGQSLWGLTWSGDIAKGIVGLLGKAQALGEAFHITTDEILTWDQIYQTFARAAGCAAKLVHISSEFIARRYPDAGAALIGDLMYSAVYDNAKIKRIVPEYKATMSLADGIAKSIAWFDADPARRVVDGKVNAMLDDLVAAAHKALESKA
jgi:nucleoside-diphosphate-sugar epimerase